MQRNVVACPKAGRHRRRRGGRSNTNHSSALSNAEARFARAAAVCGAITSNEPTEREQMYRSLVKGIMQIG
jgi:hypothetical protein